MEKNDEFFYQNFLSWYHQPQIVCVFFLWFHYTLLRRRGRKYLLLLHLPYYPVPKKDQLCAIKKHQKNINLMVQQKKKKKEKKKCLWRRICSNALSRPSFCLLMVETREVLLMPSCWGLSSSSLRSVFTSLLLSLIPKKDCFCFVFPRQKKFVWKRLIEIKWHLYSAKIFVFHFSSAVLSQERNRIERLFVSSTHSDKQKRKKWWNIFLNSYQLGKIALKIFLAFGKKVF